jgi:hypothetical protein
MDDLDGSKVDFEGFRLKFATALGLFAMQFAYLERDVNTTIHTMLGLGKNEGSALTTAINSFALRLDILRTLVEQLKPQAEIAEKLLAALDDAEELNGVRNSYLHEPWNSPWTLLSDPDIRFQKIRHRRNRRKQIYEWKAINVTIPEIEGQTAACLATCVAFSQTISDLRGKHPKKIV